MTKVLFLVQGEGRGHLTQAISMSQLLREAGHEVVAVLVGGPQDRPVPAFFQEQINAPVEAFASPNLVFSGAGKVDFTKTVVHHLPHIGRFLGSLKQINTAIQRYQPELILNFYEILSGFYNLFYRPSIPTFCIGHQYLFFHPDFKFPPQKKLDRFLVNLNTRFTAIGAKKRLALSFDALPDQPSKGLWVVSPLLRRDIRTLTVDQQAFILIYLNHPSLFSQIQEWHRQNPDVEIHCFWSKPDAPPEEKVSPNLTLHKLDGVKFLEMMSQCKALVTTAGFESVCEAMYLDKPVMVVPIHYEQACNAADTERVGGGVAASTFDLSVLMKYLPHHRPVGNNFRKWCGEGEKKWLKHFEL